MFFTLGLMLAGTAATADDDVRRAHYNYQMFCQGCHTPDGSGAGDVPRLKGQVGVFLNSQAGQEFLVRVPGAATSALDNEQLAELLNWIVREFAGASIPANWRPYSGREVGALRKQPLKEVIRYRGQILADIARARH
ncbi:MAG: cytochrome c, class I [Halieaceae bacterium]|nr:cytochrome c, class I [Halieaceae bacterium]